MHISKLSLVRRDIPHISPKYASSPFSTCFISCKLLTGILKQEAGLIKNVIHANEINFTLLQDPCPVFSMSLGLDLCTTVCSAFGPEQVERSEVMEFNQLKL